MMIFSKFLPIYRLYFREPFLKALLGFLLVNGGEKSFALETGDEEEFSSNSFSEEGEEIFGDYEQRMFQIYKTYHQLPISDRQWRAQLNRKDTDEHRVQKGDTLWDISKILFDDPNYWPKIWSVNSSFIDNPHRISPDQILSFVYGTANTPPSLKLDEGEDDFNQKKDRLEALQVIRERKFADQSIEKPIAVLKNFPLGLGPITLFLPEEKRQEAVSISFGKLAQKTKHSLSYFMTGDPDFEHGTILRKIDKGRWASLEHHLLVEMGSPVSQGAKFSVLKNIGRVPIFRRGISGPYGYQIQIQGEIQIVGAIDAEEGIYQAKVTRSFSPITEGSMVSLHPIGEYTIEDTRNRGSGSEAQIIGMTPTARTRKWASLFSLMYINRGSKDGYRKSQIYEIQMNPDSRPFYDYGYPLSAGRAKVIDVDERFSTLIVIDIFYPIRVGDLIIPEGTGVRKQYELIGERTSSSEDFREEAEDEGDFLDDDDDFLEETQDSASLERQTTKPSSSPNEQDIEKELLESQISEDQNEFIDEEDAFITSDEEYIDEGDELRLEDFKEVPNDPDELEAEFESDFE